MTGRSPARALAPVALVAAAIALFAILASGGGDSASDPASTSAPEATVTATPTPEKQGGKKKATSGGTYTVEPGDTPSGIAEKTGVELEALLQANPGIDADALTVGEELALP